MSMIENNVCRKIKDRAKVGHKKYGVTMERDDLSRLDWLIHAQQEAMDLVVYLEKLIQVEQPIVRGREGGVARAEKLLPERRSEIASNAAKGRWGRK